MTKYSQKHREEYKRQGFVQVNAWIPAEHKDKVMSICRDLRNEKLTKPKESA